jgi:multicomponent K+:H+ antiporter subunit C
MTALIVSLAIGVLAASGVWLIQRPRTFQVAIGLSLLAYAVNLFIFAMGRLRMGVAPIVEAGKAEDQPRVVQEARDLCRATCGFAIRWKCVGELFVFAQSWSNNRRMQLDEATSVGHACHKTTDGIATTRNVIEPR